MGTPGKPQGKHIAVAHGPPTSLRDVKRRGISFTRSIDGGEVRMVNKTRERGPLALAASTRPQSHAECGAWAGHPCMCHSHHGDHLRGRGGELGRLRQPSSSTRWELLSP